MNPQVLLLDNDHTLSSKVLKKEKEIQGGPLGDPTWHLGVPLQRELVLLCLRFITIFSEGGALEIIPEQLVRKQ